MNGASRRTQGNQMLESGKGRSQNNPMPTRSLKQRSLKQRRWMKTCFGNWFLVVPATQMDENLCWKLVFGTIAQPEHGSEPQAEAKPRDPYEQGLPQTAARGPAEEERHGRRQRTHMSHRPETSHGSRARRDRRQWQLEGLQKERRMNGVNSNAQES